MVNFQIYITRTEIWRNGPVELFLVLGLRSRYFKFLGVIYLFVCRAYKVEWYVHPIFLLGSTEGDSAWQKGLSKSLCGRLDNPWKNEKWMRMNEKNGKREWILPTDFTFCPLCSVITDTSMVCLLSTFAKTTTQKCSLLEDGSSKIGWKNA